VDRPERVVFIFIYSCMPDEPLALSASSANAKADANATDSQQSAPLTDSRRRTSLAAVGGVLLLLV
jgi:hypothetical protein